VGPNPQKPGSFGANSRLRSPEFGKVLKSGKSIRAQDLVISVMRNQVPEARLGVVVPKRLLARAVDRNRCKRLVREWFRLHQDQMSGRDWVFRLIRVPKKLDAEILSAFQQNIARLQA
jgi:ribonuclease P protein component